MLYKLQNHKHKLFPYALLLPSIVLFFLFTLVPILRAFVMSLYFIRGEEQRFVGLANYLRLLQDSIFWKSVGNVLSILMLQVPVMILLAMILAVLLNQGRLLLRNVFRLGIFMPAVTSLVAYTIIFAMILAQEGILNKLLEAIFGIAPIDWLERPWLAKFSLMLGMTWRWTGYNMVIFLAALQGIPRSIYEASYLEGCSKLQEFWRITVPMLRPVILFTAVLSINGTLQLFDEPFNLTNGGPNDATITPVLYLYRSAFNSFDFGYAATISYVLVLIIAVVSAMQFLVSKER